MNVDVERHSCDMAGTSVKVRDSNSLMYSVPQDTDAPCMRKDSDSPTIGTNTTACNSLVYTRLTLVPSEVFPNHASKFVAVWLTEVLFLRCISQIIERRIIRAPTVEHVRS